MPATGGARMVRAGARLVDLRVSIASVANVEGESLRLIWVSPETSVNPTVLPQEDGARELEGVLFERSKLLIASSSPALHFVRIFSKNLPGGIFAKILRQLEVLEVMYIREGSKTI